jgi:hypothetical protein
MGMAVWDVISCPGRFQAWQLRIHGPGFGLAISEEGDRREELAWSKSVIRYRSFVNSPPLCTLVNAKKLVYSRKQKFLALPSPERSWPYCALS